MRFDRRLNHKIWYLAWPMIISNISVPLLGLVDTSILGHLESAAYLSAVAVGSSILSLLFWGFAFLRMGTTGLAAQESGAGRHDQGRLVLGQSVILALVLGLIIILLSPLIVSIGLQLVVPPTGTYELAANYTQIRLFSAPAMLVNFAIVGWLIGYQNTRGPLLIALTINGLNVILDLVLIIGLGMNSDGAALATVIAEYSGCLVASWILYQHLAKKPGQLSRALLWRWQDYQRLLMVNRHILFRTLALLGSFAFFTAQGADQGETILAANTIIIQLLFLTAYGLDGFANAAEALVGDSIGRRHYPDFLSTCYHCGLWSAATAGLFTLFFWLGGPYLVGMMTSLEEVRSQALRFLPWLVCLPLVAVWTYLLDGIFIGATKTAAMQNTMLLSVLGVYLPTWYLTQHWGNHGLWLAFILLNLARSLSMAVVFHQYNRHRLWWPKGINN